MRVQGDRARRQRTHRSPAPALWFPARGRPANLPRRARTAWGLQSVRSLGLRHRTLRHETSSQAERKLRARMSVELVGEALLALGVHALEMPACGQFAALYDGGVSPRPAERQAPTGHRTRSHLNSGLSALRRSHCLFGYVETLGQNRHGVATRETCAAQRFAEQPKGTSCFSNLFHIID